MKIQKPISISLAVLSGVVASPFLLGSQIYAQAPVSLTVAKAYSKGHSQYDVVVRDSPNTKLVLYVNGKNPNKATTNTKDWATFYRVKLTDANKISFTAVLKNNKGATYEEPVNYVRYVHISKGTISFSSVMPSKQAPTRRITGHAATLGAGTFSGGKDIAVGLYDVTPGAGQSGNFIVHGTDSYNEILGGDNSLGGVPKVRVQISSGDKIEISGLSSVLFAPVTAPLVTSHSGTNLYAGTFTVGQDVGAGRYVVSPGAGQSGNFIVHGKNSYNEILGGDSDLGGVPNLTVNLSNGDLIDISGLSQVTFTPSN